MEIPNDTISTIPPFFADESLLEFISKNFYVNIVSLTNLISIKFKYNLKVAEWVIYSYFPLIRALKENHLITPEIIGLRQISKNGNTYVFKGHTKYLERFIVKEAKISNFNSIVIPIREIAVLNHLKGLPNITPIYSFDFYPDKILIFLPRIYQDLHDFILHLCQTDEIIDSLIIKVIYNILIGIKCVHNNGLIHRDIKSSNILISIDCADIFLSDFGSTRIRNFNDRDYTKDVVTVTYRPPELFTKFISYEKEVDIWSLGILLLEIASGNLLFGFKPVNDAHQKKVLSDVGNFPSAEFVKEFMKKNNIKYISDELKSKIMTLALSMLVQPKDRPSINSILHNELFDSVRKVIENKCEIKHNLHLTTESNLWPKIIHTIFELYESCPTKINFDTIWLVGYITAKMTLYSEFSVKMISSCFILSIILDESIYDIDFKGDHEIDKFLINVNKILRFLGKDIFPKITFANIRNAIGNKITVEKLHYSLLYMMRNEYIFFMDLDKLVDLIINFSTNHTIEIIERIYMLSLT